MENQEEEYLSIRYNSLKLLTAYNEDIKSKRAKKPDIIRILVFQVDEEFVIHVPEYAFLDYQGKVFESKVNYNHFSEGWYAGIDWLTLSKEEEEYSDSGTWELSVGFDGESENEDDWKYIKKTVPCYFVYTMEEVGFEHG